MYTAGVVRIKDLIDERGNFIKWEALPILMRKNIPFTRYLGLIQAIPREWKKRLLDDVDKINHLQILIKLPKPVSLIYRELQKKGNILSTNYSKWRNLGMEISEEDYRRAFHNINKLTIVVKLRAFQYKLLLGVVTTNVHLFYYKIKDTKLCTFCEKSIETLIHLLYECKTVKPLINWLESKNNGRIAIENYLLSEIGSMVCNTLSLFVKYHVYARRCQNMTPSVNSLKNYLEQICIVEKAIAKDKGKINSHEQKWQFIQS